ncbi:hypothetical protein CAPTEDRAFT_207113 [Capitella teleta]|uniref:Apple domain-containing protein n=1 Tax=Capitella teleta TaxID=283909 RepID=R7UEN6_CAPTE|nr:hypothetical protein CAPTEDRAFT_207113 [Capitella teleta]|eukprot:ELU01742.1 hypothetical protein CAPTEDRAFT_207113 [Capitella teleta]
MYFMKMSGTLNSMKRNDAQRQEAKVCCQDIKSDIFSKMKGKFYPTSYSLSLTKVRSELQCVSLCESQKCCLSVLTYPEDGRFLCRTLDTYILIDDLVDDAIGSYMYKTDPDALSNFLWSSIVKRHRLFQSNIFTKFKPNIGKCRELCAKTAFCMSIDYNAGLLLIKACLLL